MSTLGALLWGLGGSALVEALAFVEAGKADALGPYKSPAFMAAILVRLLSGAGAAAGLAAGGAVCSVIPAAAVGAATPYLLFDRVFDTLFPPRAP